MTRRWGAVLLALAAVTVALGGGPSAGATTRTDDPPAGRRVLVIAVPGLRWVDVESVAAPHLRALLDESSIANLATRITGHTSRPADGYLTIGAGTRAVASSTLGGVAYDGSEPFGAGTAAEEYARQQGQPLRGAIASLSWVAARRPEHQDRVPCRDRRPRRRSGGGGHRPGGGRTGGRHRSADHGRPGPPRRGALAGRFHRRRAVRVGGTRPAGARPHGAVRRAARRAGGGAGGGALLHTGLRRAGGGLGPSAGRLVRVPGDRRASRRRVGGRPRRHRPPRGGTPRADRSRTRRGGRGLSHGRARPRRPRGAGSGGRAGAAHVRQHAPGGLRAPHRCRAIDRRAGRRPPRRRPHRGAADGVSGRPRLGGRPAGGARQRRVRRAVPRPDGQPGGVGPRVGGGAPCHRGGGDLRLPLRPVDPLAGARRAGGPRAPGRHLPGRAPALPRLGDRVVLAVPRRRIARARRGRAGAAPFADPAPALRPRPPRGGRVDERRAARIEAPAVHRVRGLADHRRAASRASTT